MYQKIPLRCDHLWAYGIMSKLSGMINTWSCLIHNASMSVQANILVPFLDTFCSSLLCLLLEVILRALYWGCLYEDLKTLVVMKPWFLSNLKSYICLLRLGSLLGALQHIMLRQEHPAGLSY